MLHPEFADSERMQDFLRFIVEEKLAGRAEGLKGYTIGVEVFGRDESFDPQIDTIVRIHAGRLRRKMQLYYSEEGRNDPIHIQVPKGSYVPIWQVRPRPESEPAAKDPVEKEAPDEEPTLELPDKPSIAVLPLENLSRDPEQEYFTDGITEDIITELSRFRTLFVIAYNSSFVFRDKDLDVTEVGRKLGVQYVVEGSVRKAGNKVRVTAQLIDAATGHHLWAERYDRELQDIFAVQDEITQAIVSTLPGRLDDAGWERAKRKRTANMTAYDYLLLGLERFKHMSREQNAEARSMFQKAVDLDPQYARAHALLAATHVWDVYRETSTDESLDKGYESLERALALDDDSWSRAVFGLTLFMRREDEEAEIQFQRALALNSNDAEVAAYWANVLVYLGRLGEALEWIGMAKRLNPFPPPWYHWYRALALYSAREYEQAASTFKEMRPLHRSGHAYLAACYAHMNRMDEARAEIAIFVEASQRQLRESGQNARPATIGLALERAGRYRNPSDREHFLDGLRKAGLPE